MRLSEHALLSTVDRPLQQRGNMASQFENNGFTARRAWVHHLPAILSLLVLVTGIPAALAQGAGTCTVTGTVYDALGAVVPDAQVQLALQTTGTARETKAD